jgi:DMSO/TMAO reductase YedYZ molybdopterin-dependent catalytic subunit
MVDIPRATAPAIRVLQALGPGRTRHRQLTVIHVLGEHDFASRSILAEALEPLEEDVIVDLSGCTFIETMVVGMIIGKALALRNNGFCLELIVPPTAAFVWRAVEQLGVRTLLPVHDWPASQLPPL